MEKIILGKTGMMVSRLGLGGIPIQRLSEDDAIAVVKRCLDVGINYIDTANGYTNSEERIGKAITGRREDVILATKSAARTCEELKSHIQLSLKRINVDYIDLYQFHNVSDFKTMNMILDLNEGLINVLEEAKNAGIIKHIGVSSHQMDVAKALIKAGRFETIMFAFNFVACEAAEELLPLAREHDLGFIAMKPLAGGRLDNATIAFKYLFQFPDVIPIPGIDKLHQIEEIVRVLESSDGLTAAEWEEMQRLKGELGTRFCRNCEYCMPCPQEIIIPMMLSFPVIVKSISPEDFLSERFAGPMEKAGTCIECGECEAKCPYHLPIMELIAEHFRLYEVKKNEYQK